MALPLHLIASLAFLLFTIEAFAGSAAWLANPISGDWNSAGNWTPGGPPNGAADNATFGLSSVTAISLSANTEINTVLFGPNASPFTITTNATLTLIISGSGITNNSGITQNFVVAADAGGHSGAIIFASSATAGARVALTTSGGLLNGFTGGHISFDDTSNAGSSTVTNRAGVFIDTAGGITLFHDSSSASNGTFINEGAKFPQSPFVISSGGTTAFFDNATASNGKFVNNAGAGGAIGGLTTFGDNSNAGSGTFINNGGTVDNAGGGETQFFGNASADSASFLNNGGEANGAGGGITVFDNHSTAGSGTFVSNGGTVTGAGNGTTYFRENSSAGNGTFVANGALTDGADPGVTGFLYTTTASTATLIANGGTGGGRGGIITFAENSTGDMARVMVFGNGNLDISGHLGDGITIGSLEGNGEVFLGAKQLVVGSNNTSTTFSGVAQDEGLSGGSGGSLAKIGNGVLVLSGSNTYTGDTSVDGGVLQVTGSIASPNTVVNAMGMLSGSGRIGGSVFNSGVISPGDSPGTLTINGNYVQTATGKLQIEIGGLALPQHDLLSVSGSAMLAGNLQVVLLDGFSLHRDELITFLTANAGVNGTFTSTSVDTNSILRTQVIYNPTTVSLMLLQGSFTSVGGLTPNEFAVASMLDRVVGNPELVQLIELLDTAPLESLPAIFDRIAPEELTAIFEIGISTAAVQSYNIENRLEEIRAGSNGFSSTLSLRNSRDLNQGSGKDISDGQGKSVIEQATGPQVSQNRWGFFVSGSGEFVTVNSDFNARGYDFESGGVSLGLDYRLSEQLAIGLTGGYLHTNTDLADGGDIEANGGKLGIYATWFSAGAYLNAFAEGGLNNYETQRSALLGLARGETDGAEFNALFGGGYDFKFGNCTVGPTASLQYDSVGIDSFAETGSFAPLIIDSQNEDALRTRLGAHLSCYWKLGSVIVRPEISAEWKHEFLDRALAIDSSIAGIPGSAFTVHGPARGHDSAVLSAGIAIQCSARMQAFADCRAEVGRDNYDQQSVTGGLRVEF